MDVGCGGATTGWGVGLAAGATTGEGAGAGVEISKSCETLFSLLAVEFDVFVVEEGARISFEGLTGMS